MRTDLPSSTGCGELLLAVSIELAAAKWKVALHDGQREKPAIHTVADAHAAVRLQAVLIDAHKQKWHCLRMRAWHQATRPARTRSGSIVRYRLAASECDVIDAATIPVERHRRRAKTGRLDVIKLVTNLRAWLRGERDRMHVVHVPSIQDEASRQMMRDRGQLQKEVLQHRDRIRKLLMTLGCWDDADHRSFAGRLAHGEVKCYDGTPHFSRPPQPVLRL
jgi:transposase